MSKAKRILIFVIAASIVFLILILISSALIYPPEYIGRILRWGNSDVNDFQKFPNRPLLAANSSYEFAISPGDDQVQANFASIARVPDFESFLEYTGTQAFIVIQNGTIRYEQYFNDASRDSVVTSFSVAKSFTSTLIGIAISEGYINSVNDPITDYLPELLERDPAFAGITIRDLLMMSSGIKYEEFPFVNGDDAKTYYYPDLRLLALTETYVVGIPGEHFLYNNYHPLLLGMILERATGTSVTNYLQEKIWTPIGMEYPGSWSLDERGFEKMESGINARAIDFAKFGLLLLNNGLWHDEQVISYEWVVEATQADIGVDYEDYYYNGFLFADGLGYYKYMWWGMQRDENNYDFIALGNHGQFIYISPQANLVIVRFGETYGEFGNAEGWVDLFYEFASNYTE
jgi:CubicO group peptidase (beta-lactamase class C family)